MGHVLSNGLELMGTGTSIQLDLKFKGNIDHMMELAGKTKLTKREEKHVDAMKKLADGYVSVCVPLCLVVPVSVSIFVSFSLSFFLFLSLTLYVSVCL